MANRRGKQNNPRYTPRTPPNNQGSNHQQTTFIPRSGIRGGVNRVGNISPYGTQGSNSAGGTPQIGNPHGHGTSFQITPPRFFGNIPLYINPAQSPHNQTRHATTYQESTQWTQPNVLRAEAQSFHPQSAQNIPPLDPTRLMVNPLQVGLPGSPQNNRLATPEFPRIQNFSTSSPPFYQNFPAMSDSPFSPKRFPNFVESGFSPWNQSFPNVNSFTSAPTRFSLLSK